MVILSDRKGRKMQISYTYGVNDDTEGRHSRAEYKVVMPDIVCNDSKDAIYIQTQVNKFIYNLTHDLMK